MKNNDIQQNNEAKHNNGAKRGKSAIRSKHRRSLAALILALALASTGVLSSVALAESSGVSDGTTTANTSDSSSVSTAPSSEQETKSQGNSKEEIVYANLDSTGSVNKIYVVNEFSFKTAGTLRDFGDYESVANLTNTDPLEQSGEEVSASVEAGTFYYEGILKSSDLPWDFSIEYYLDGKKKNVEELAGKSGSLEIKISSKQNITVDNTFYDNYMLQITVTIGAESNTNIASEGATIANSGKNKTVVHTVMPGKDADISITAEVNDFTMEGIQISGIPYSTSVEMSETDELVDEMSLLADAVSEINEGVAELASGTSKTASGAAKLTSGSADFNSGLARISAGSADLVNGSSTINQTLKTIVAEMEGSGSIDLSELEQLPGYLRSAAQGLEDAAGSLEALKGSYAQALGALDTAMNDLPSGAAETGSLQLLIDNAADAGNAQSELNALVAAYNAGANAKGVYGSTKAVFDGVQTALDGLLDNTSESSLYGLAAGLEQMATGIEDALANSDLSSLQDLMDGLAKLSGQYEVFHSGLVKYTDGVDAAAANYAKLHSSLAELSGGLNDTAVGVQELYAGTNELDESLADLPQEMQTKIDEMMEEYTGKEFDPVSFVSSKNENVSFVQFIFTTESIAVEDEPIVEVEEEKDSSILDQFLALFSL